MRVIFLNRYFYPALREAMGARSHALLCERYDKRIAFKAWLQLLREL